MATFDQLPADQRAIIELVLKRGRTYDALSDMLDMPTSRVRELARDALSELAPYTADRVDPDWRDQVADYVLGQQSGPESTATQGHLRRSEPARAWLLSLLDSLDQLYVNGKQPEVPEAEGSERPRARERKERGDRGRREREPAARAETRRDRDRNRERERDDDADRDEDEDERTKTTPLTGGREGGPLSPAARAAVMRRRWIGGIAALVVLIAGAFLLVRALGGDDDDDGNASNPAPNRTANADAPAGQQRPQLLGQLELRPPGGGGGRNTAGLAVLAKTGDKFQLVVQAQLPPRTGQRQAYEVWLWNSNKDAISVGAQRTDQQGLYQGAGDIPNDYAKYKYIDISAETVDRNRAHSGRSVLRGALADMQAPPQQGAQGGQGGQGAAPGAPATPGAPGAPGAAP